MSTQWHPLFARLLGIQLGDYYDIETEVPVSDLPRAGDILIVRRQVGPEPPFRGLWNYLTDVNAMEFKGRTDDASADDLEKFMHVGTGIAHRLEEKRRDNQQPLLDHSQVSFWYIAPTLGRTFLDAVRRRTVLEYEGNGLYKGRVWGHPVFFVSARDTAIEEDTVPLWLVEGDPAPRAVGEFVVQHETSLRRFATWLAKLQPALWQEVHHMTEFSDLIDWKEVAKVIDWRAAAKGIDWGEVSKAVDANELGEMIGAIGPERVLDVLGSQLSVEQLEELLKRRKEQASPPSEDAPS